VVVVRFVAMPTSAFRTDLELVDVHRDERTTTRDAPGVVHTPTGSDPADRFVPSGSPKLGDINEQCRSMGQVSVLRRGRRPDRRAVDERPSEGLSPGCTRLMMAPGTMHEARVRGGVLLCRWCEVADRLDDVVGIGLRQRLQGAHRF
jgi:hypothetical protein